MVVFLPLPLGEGRGEGLAKTHPKNSIVVEFQPPADTDTKPTKSHSRQALIPNPSPKREKIPS